MSMTTSDGRRSSMTVIGLESGDERTGATA